MLGCLKMALLVSLAILAAGPNPAAADTPADSAAIAKQSRRNLVAFPALFYTPETGFGGGGAAVLTVTPADRNSQDRPDIYSLSLFYTAKNQTIAGFDPEIDFCDGAYLARGLLKYVNYPNAFHGLGNATRESDREEYTTEEIGAEGELGYRLLGSLRLGLRYVWKRVNMLAIETDGLLDGEQLTGARGGTSSGLGPVLQWDRRDATLAPTRGGWFQVAMLSYSEALGSDFDYTSYHIDLRQYISMRHRHVLALQLVNMNTCGTVPFTLAPRPGNYMRGILEERYADHSIVVSRAEYRFPLIGRFSGALFLAAGTMAAELEDHALTNLLVSGGGGIRYLLDPKDHVKVRIDFGVSSEGSRIYIQIFEAF